MSAPGRALRRSDLFVEVRHPHAVEIDFNFESKLAESHGVSITFRRQFDQVRTTLPPQSPAVLGRVIARLRIFPEGPFGSSSTNSTMRGIL